MPEAIPYAEERYVNVNIFDDAHKEIANRFSHLPASCAESADFLAQQREIYESAQVFSPRLIDGLIQKLSAYQDRTLRQELGNDTEKSRNW